MTSFKITILLAVFSLNQISTAPYSRPATTPPDFQNGSCYKPKPNLFLRYESTENDIMTNNLCSLRCSKLSYNLSATHNGINCYCAKSQNPSADLILSNGKCKRACVGDTTQFCGNDDYHYTFYLIENE